MKKLLLLFTALVFVTMNCVGQFKTKTYPIYNLKGEFVCYTEIDEQIPDSIPRGVYVVNGYKVSHIPQKPLPLSEKEKALIDSLACIAAINSFEMHIINGKKCDVINDSIIIVNGKIVYKK